MPMNPIGFWTPAGGGSTFAPTVSGRLGLGTTATRVVEGSADDYVLGGGSSADGSCAIWVLRTGGDVYIRVGCRGAGNGTPVEQWYNQAGAGQGDPGEESTAGTTIFQLNEDVDTVNIYASAFDSTTTGSPNFAAIGTFTDDQKTTFFLPTADVKYGRSLDCDGGGGTGLNEALISIEVTFRKAGLDDYTVKFTGFAFADWESDV